LIDFTLQQLLFRLCAFVVVAAVHGAAIAAAACALGDQGPRHDGRLRFNPLVHLDLLGTVSGVLFSVGWAKPVAVDPTELRFGRAGLLLVVMAGMLATVLTAVALVLLRPLILPLLPDTASQVTYAIIEAIGQLSLWFVLFNLGPVPPLTGAHFVTAIVPGLREKVQRTRLYGAIVLTLVAASGLPVRWLGGAYGTLARLILAN
jgi:Zn-dependent protease